MRLEAVSGVFTLEACELVTGDLSTGWSLGRSDSPTLLRLFPGCGHT